MISVAYYTIKLTRRLGQHMNNSVQRDGWLSRNKERKENYMVLGFNSLAGNKIRKNT